jgi:hypothetical protein
MPNHAERTDRPRAVPSSRCLARLSPLIFAIVVVAAPGGAAGPLSAQETIAADRPGIGSGSAVVSRGIVQAEAGVSYAEGGNVRTVSIGQLFVRYGLAERVELELLANSFVVRRIDAGPSTLDDEGIEDLAVGAKARLVRSERATLSLQGIVTSSSGSAAFGSGEWYGTLNGLLDVGLAGGAGLNVNLGVRPGVGDLATVVAANVTPGVSLDDGFGLYGGWAGTFVSGADTNYLEAGGTLLLGRNVQLDINGAWSVDADDWFFGAGVAVRGGG